MRKVIYFLTLMLVSLSASAQKIVDDRVTDTETLTNEFLHARNEIWTQYHKMAHLTTNLTNEQLKQKYRDGFGRLLDRFKTYNVIPLAGESRR